MIVPVEELLPPGDAAKFLETLHDLIRSYRRTLQGDRKHLLEDFRFVHLARKVVGVGSVGTRAWIVLMLGRDGQDPLFLQAKEAQASVLEPFVGKSRYANHGQRVVEGQRLMQASSDIFLGWKRLAGFDGVVRDFYIRQLRDWKGSWAPEAMVPQVMNVYGQMCGWTLARAHARSGDRIAIASYLGDSGRLRPGDRVVLGGVCRPERTGLRRAEGRRESRQDQGNDRGLNERRCGNRVEEEQRWPEYLPKELIFSVSYLGGDHLPTLALNFSRPGA